MRATIAQYHAATAADPLPIERLFAAHDAVVARWMAYETDVAKALAYPQLSDTRQPATLAFLRAYREAQQLRPASARERIPPEQFLAYRDAVRALEAAFDEAERQAGAALPTGGAAHGDLADPRVEPACGCPPPSDPSCWQPALRPDTCPRPTVSMTGWSHSSRSSATTGGSSSRSWV